MSTEVIDPPATAVALRPISRVEILELEALMVAIAAQAQPEFRPGCTDAIAPVRHHFAPGLYARECFLPAGTRIIGKIHKTSHFMQVTKGSGIVWNEFDAFEYEAGLMKVTRPGAKNVVWAREDSIIITFHPTKHAKLEDIERDVIAESYAEFDALPMAAKEIAP